MRFDIISLFPETIENYCSISILGRAITENKIQIHSHHLREYGLGNYKKVDNIPYGGGTGMILAPEPIFNCYENIPKLNKFKTIVLTPRGIKLTQPFIRENLNPENTEQIILICGRYEGIDERVMSLADYQISIGDYILTGGEIGAMIIIDTVTRLVPGVLNDSEIDVTGQDSFSDAEGVKKEAPQYTRPREFKGMEVPEVLLNGNHKEIKKWREEQSI